MANQNKTDIGLIGLAVMGENLALNMESKGWNVDFGDKEEIEDYSGYYVCGGQASVLTCSFLALLLPH